MANDWIEHDGLRKPPLTQERDFYTRTRNGVEQFWSAGELFDDEWWVNSDEDSDIIAYRLAAPAAETCEHEWEQKGPLRFCRKCSTLQQKGKLPARFARDMTVRERFAMAAPITLADAMKISGFDGLHEHDRKQLFTAWALLRYEWADAMLLAALKEADSDS